MIFIFSIEVLKRMTVSSSLSRTLIKKNGVPKKGRHPLIFNGRQLELVENNLQISTYFGKLSTSARCDH
jgi:hypothetical protein